MSIKKTIIECDGLTYTESYERHGTDKCWTSVERKAPVSGEMRVIDGQVHYAHYVSSKRPRAFQFGVDYLIYWYTLSQRGISDVYSALDSKLNQQSSTLHSVLSSVDSLQQCVMTLSTRVKDLEAMAKKAKK